MSKRTELSSNESVAAQLRVWAERPTTIVFTDIVKSTSTNIRLGDIEMNLAKAFHFATVRALARVYGGVIVKEIGDSAMVAFPEALNGVRFARDAYQNTGSSMISIRAAVHRGEVEAVGPDLQGSEVNYAARLMGVVKQSGVVLSAATMHDITRRFGRDAGILSVTRRNAKLSDFGWETVYRLKAVSAPVGFNQTITKLNRPNSKSGR